MTPESIQKLYDKHLQGEKPRLSQDEIREELHRIMKDYTQIFIAIDALDECKTDPIRDRLLSAAGGIRHSIDGDLQTQYRSQNPKHRDHTRNSSPRGR